MWTSSMPFKLSCSHSRVSHESIRIKASQQCLACSGAHYFVPHLFCVLDGILFLPEFLMKQPLFSARLMYGILLFGALRQRHYILNDKQRSTSFQNVSLSTDWTESNEGGLGKGWDKWTSGRRVRSGMPTGCWVKHDIPDSVLCRQEKEHRRHTPHPCLVKY